MRGAPSQANLDLEMVARAQPVIERLRAAGIQPSAQRVAVASYVLATDEHPSAERVWTVVKRTLPVISRATVYNTLNLLVRHGLLHELVLAPGRTVFDPKLERHHHFVDDDTGRIIDVPWDAIAVGEPRGLPGLAVREYQVVMRGRQRTARARR
ncbi:MAG: transcriptional repressor [Nannocystaceae bacterium]|nr:transcriptional repressor [Nannocystaceae bacterium]